MKTVVISLGGSMIVQDEVDISFLKSFREVMIDFVKSGNRAVIVCGGGKVCRKYQNAALELSHASDTDRDWIGIKATKLNAELVRVMFGKQAYEKVIDNPSSKIKTAKKIIVGSGYLPGHSSDVDAVLLAKNFKADTLINISNVDFVYDKDPRQSSDAKKFERMSWKEFLTLFNVKWKPGLNVPFDPIAAKTAMKLKLKVMILDGKDMENVKDALYGKTFVGTVIS